MKIKIHQNCQMSINLIQNNKANFIKDLKGVFAKNERGYRLNAIKKRF